MPFPLASLAHSRIAILYYNSVYKCYTHKLLFLSLQFLDLATANAFATAARLCLCGVLFPGLIHVVQEDRIDDVRRPAQHTQFRHYKRQNKGEEDTRRKS
jgi:hypothetical protein